MIRLFVGLALPEQIRTQLSFLSGAMPGARWIAPEELHLTLRFIGEVDERRADDIDLALARMSGQGFEMTLAGLGQFGDATPHTIYAGVATNEALSKLAMKIDAALRMAGLPPETRRFTPHITLARLKNVPLARVMDFISAHSLFRSAPFLVREFILFSSHLGHGGSHYMAEAEYPLDFT